MKLIPIINITPDSFSSLDNGLNNSNNTLIYIEKLVDNGAEIIDIGAESTRPNATPLTHIEEQERLSIILPEIIQIIKGTNCEISLDTYHPETAKFAGNIGVDWINDVTGLQNINMINAIKSTCCKAIFMHSLTIPTNPEITFANNVNIVNEMVNFANNHLKILHNYGIKNIIFDVGIGFGKTACQSFELITRASEIKSQLHCPLLIGHSRKSFLKLFTEKPANKRDELTILCSAFLKKSNVDYIRIHNFFEHKKMLSRLI